MKTGVVGSRYYTDYKRMKEVLDNLDPKPTEIISGGAKGADTLAERYAKENNLIFTCFPPLQQEINSSGFAQAAKNRNKRIVDDCQRLVAFPLEGSRGTWHSINLGIEKRTIEVHIIDTNYKQVTGAE